jgi:hypothetical protein
VIDRASAMGLLRDWIPKVGVRPANKTEFGFMGCRNSMASSHFFPGNFYTFKSARKSPGMSTCLAARNEHLF